MIQALNFFDLRKQYVSKNQVIFCERLSNLAKYEVQIVPTEYKDDGTKVECKYFMSLIFGSDSCQHSEFQGFDELVIQI